jgi:hypothetical protein
MRWLKTMELVTIVLAIFISHLLLLEWMEYQLINLEEFFVFSFVSRRATTIFLTLAIFSHYDVKTNEKYLAEQRNCIFSALFARLLLLL